MVSDVSSDRSISSTESGTIGISRRVTRHNHDDEYNDNAANNRSWSSLKSSSSLNSGTTSSFIDPSFHSGNDNNGHQNEEPTRIVVGSIVISSHPMEDRKKEDQRQRKALSYFIAPPSKRLSSSSIWPFLTAIFFILTVVSNLPLKTSILTVRASGSPMEGDSPIQNRPRSAMRPNQFQSQNGNKQKSNDGINSNVQRGDGYSKKESLRTSISSSTTKVSTTFASSKPPSSSFSTPSKIVLMPGPHKTGSTTTQHFIYNHATRFDTDEQPIMGHLDEWIWPTPSQQELNDIGFRAPGDFKNYAALYGILSQQPSFVLPPSNDTTATRTGNLPSEQQQQQLIDLYRSKIHHAWSTKLFTEEGSSQNIIQNKIVFGSEEMDWIASGYPFAHKLLDETMNMLPFHDDPNRPLALEEVEAVILHRSEPRVSHLRSIWKEVDRATGSTFQQFLLKNEPNLFFIVDSLSLALQFLHYGIKTTIVDIHGIQHADKDMSHTIACEVLKVPCTDDGYVRSLLNDGTSTGTMTTMMRGGGSQRRRLAEHEQEKEEESKEEESKEDVDQLKSLRHNPSSTSTEKSNEHINSNTGAKKMNQRSDPSGGLGGLDEMDLDRINDIIREYDCGLRAELQEYVNLGMVRFLYPMNDDLFAHCPSPSDGNDIMKRRPLSWLIESIQKIASEKPIVSPHS